MLWKDFNQINVLQFSLLLFSERSRRDKHRLHLKKGMTGKSEICRGLPRLALYVLEVWILISRCWIGYWRRAFFQHVWKNSSFKNSMVDGGPKKKSFYTTSRSQKIPEFYSQKSRDFDSWKIPGSRDSVRACSWVNSRGVKGSRCLLKFHKIKFYPQYNLKDKAGLDR